MRKKIEQYMMKKRQYTKRQSYVFDYKKLDKLIKESGLNKQEFANAIGLKRPVISKLVNQLSKDPNAYTVIKIADFFKITDIRDFFIIK